MCVLLADWSEVKLLKSSDQYNIFGANSAASEYWTSETVITKQWSAINDRTIGTTSVYTYKFHTLFRILFHYLFLYLLLSFYVNNSFIISSPTLCYMATRRPWPQFGNNWCCTIIIRGEFYRLVNSLSSLKCEGKNNQWPQNDHGLFPRWLNHRHSSRRDWIITITIE